MDSAEFTNRFLISEVEKMHAAGVELHLLSAITHGIETSGALLDSLPFKAKGQGKKRFNLALKKLFPKEYLSANMKLDLYSQLRSHMAHCMLPAKSILIASKESEYHLLFKEKLLHISLEQLYIDYCCAMQLLLETLESGELKNKRIAFDNLNSLSK
ncbi:hypothetical protein OAE48_00515 [Flavobacteriales bacterium]|nr:hypothetical protein [Flavobacteriales bacterium]